MEKYTKQELRHKVERAIKLLQSIPSNDIELAFSGGKDSSVILELAKMAKIKFTPIYKNTTIDPPGNIAFCKKMGCEIMSPKMSFFEIIRDGGFPTRTKRMCCRFLKEYKIKDHCILGIRRKESKARNKRYTEPEMCRIYGNGGKKKKDGSNYCKQYLPILDWTDEDVEEFIKMYNVEVNPYYYNDKGEFDVKRRLGCMCCPMQSKVYKTFMEHPQMVRLYIKNAMIWWNKDRKKELTCKKRFGNVYNLFFRNVFCDSYEDYLLKVKGFWGELDCKSFLEDFFKIKL